MALKLKYKTPQSICNIMTVTAELLDAIKQEYGFMSSWAIWGEMLPHLLHTKTIFVGYNISKKIATPFSNFHEGRNDYRIKEAIKGTLFEGSYMTDIIKDFEEKSSGKMKTYLKANPNFVTENIASFIKELEFIGAKNPILIAFGEDCYALLKKHLPNYTVLKVTHYSSFTTNERRRAEMLEKEKTVKLLLNS
jgi:hypothetical protein